MELNFKPEPKREQGGCKEQCNRDGFNDGGEWAPVDRWIRCLGIHAVDVVKYC